MTLKFTYRTLEQDLSAANLELKAETGEAYEIVNMAVDGAGANALLRVLIGTELMATPPIDDADAELLKWVATTGLPLSFFKQAKNAALPVPTFKVAAGEKIVLSSTTSDGTAYIIYKKWTEGQGPKKTDPGGSESKTRLFFLNGRTTEEIAAVSTESFEIVNSVNPAGQPKFPFEANVPVGWTFDVLAICTRKNDGSGADITYTGIRWWKEESSLLGLADEFAEPTLFPYQEGVANWDINWFDDPIRFDENEESFLEVQAANGHATNAEDAIIDVCLIVLGTKR